MDERIEIAETRDEIAACFPVVAQLRPHLTEGEFTARVQRQMEQGYRLAYVRAAGEIVAAAGFRLGDNLAWGHFLYVDDLVTDAQHRSAGLGKRLLQWLAAYGREAGCDQLHLDSGMQRIDAHRFYEREGMTRAGYHFALPLGG